MLKISANANENATPLGAHSNLSRGEYIPVEQRDHMSQIAHFARQRGLSYGQLQGLIYEQRQKEEADKRRREEEAIELKLRMEHGWKSCPVCGEVFLPTKGYGSLACSTECRRILMDQRSKKKKPADDRKAEPTKTRYCSVCGKEFKPSSGWSAYACSPKCRVEFRERRKNNGDTA